METKGLKINFLGDSITEGCGTSGPEHCFASLLKDELELAESRNYGIAGTRFAKQRKPSDNPRFDLDFCMRAPEMAPDADVIMVLGGTNDFGHGDAPVGSDDDRTADTFIGACHVLFSSLIARYPNSRIVIMTPLHRLNEDGIYGEGKKTLPAAPLSAYVDIIRTLAKKYGLSVLDLYETSMLRADDPAFLEQYMPDGLHPNDAGHIVLAREIKEYLRSL